MRLIYGSSSILKKEKLGSNLLNHLKICQKKVIKTPERDLRGIQNTFWNIEKWGEDIVHKNT